MTAFFYHFYSTSDTPLYLEKDEVRRAQKSWLCSGCASPQPDVHHVDLTLQDGMPPGEALNFESASGVCVVKKQFLGSFDKALVQRDLYLGRVLGAEGMEFADLVTIRGVCRVVIRGRHTVKHRYCPNCGRLIYFSERRGRYLWPSPPSDHSLFEIWGGLLVSEPCFRKVTLGSWKKLGVEKLPVLDSPNDGLGALQGAIVCAA